MTGITKDRSVKDRIALLRQAMDAKAIDACIVPTGDPHMSEYISDYYRTREFITGFTGSAGTAVITAEDAGLWADSRYFLQAEDELEGSGVTLYKMRLPGTVEIHEFLMQRLHEGCRVCVDGRLVSGTWADKFRRDMAGHGMELVTDTDLVGEIWADRPDLVFNPVMEYPIEYAGVPRGDKIKTIREDMVKAGTETLILSGLSDIAWLMNLRGNDVECNPVFFAFAVMTGDEVRLYADEAAFGAEITEALEKDGIELRQYEDFYDDIKKLDGEVMLDRETSSELILESLPASVRIVSCPSPVMLRKAVKNPVEMEGIRSAHIKDGAAMCRFLYWLKTNIGKLEIDELSAAEKLHGFRAEQDLFMGDSFEAIIGYGPHGAIVHYGATPKTNIKFEPESMVLVDSGGQYLDGTTDITRTIVLGPLTDKEKTMFTAVLRGHINLARAKFPKGLSGDNLDYLAHEPLWEMGLDYRHGTGHGVGHYLNVHEGPNGFSWDRSYMDTDMPAFEEGMLTSDEPGYYEEGAFGIRHESLLLCLCGEETEFGQFMEFENVTMVPIDLEGVVPEQMQPKEIEYLNRYHQKVFETIGPLLDEEEREWLREATRAI